MTHSASPGASPVERHWQQALDAGPDCLPIERLAEPLSAADAAHMAGCARCQTEHEMLAAFEAAAPVEGEGLSVPWISAQVARRVAAEQRPAAAAPVLVVAPSTGWRLPSWALMAASLAVVAGGAALLYTPGRPDGPVTTAPVYRSTQIDVVGPTGDLETAPTTFSWGAVAGAVDYEVRLLEVDGTELWRVTTSSPTVSVPADARAAFLPARTLVWQVEARDTGGRVLASSGAIRARVRQPGAPASGR